MSIAARCTCDRMGSGFGPSTYCPRHSPGRRPLVLIDTPPEMDGAVAEAVARERERCAAICERLAKYIEDGQVPRSADRRLRQAAKYIREPRHE